MTAQMDDRTHVLDLAARVIAAFADDATDLRHEPSLVAAAMMIATVAHEGQVSPHDGRPYIRHVQRVAGLVDGISEQVVAWLHDVVEDSDIGLADLRACGFPQAIVQAVSLLTRDKAADDYDGDIRRLVDSGHALALRVKRADLLDHLRPSCPPTKRGRYEHALRTVDAALARL